MVAMLLAGLSVSGCIYVPPVWDIGDAINEVDQIEEGIRVGSEGGYHDKAARAGAIASARKDLAQGRRRASLEAA